MELEHRVHAMLEENELLQSTVDDLRERTLVLERQSHRKDLQVRTREHICVSDQISVESTGQSGASICVTSLLW